MKNCKKFLAVFLSMLMVLSMFAGINITSFAAGIDDLTYEIQNGEVTITGCDQSASGVIIIPEAIDGCPVTSIGDFAFGFCSSITSITIPDSVTTIDSYAFSGCSSLESVTIPDSVTIIGNYVFSECSSLTSITVAEENEYYSSNEDGVLFNKDKTVLVQYPVGNSRTEYVIPDSVTSIGRDAFSFCNSLTSVTIPDSVTSIDSSAFSYCSSIETITIPDSVTSISSYAFLGCSSLVSVTIPDSVTSIGHETFSSCDLLERVNIESMESWLKITFRGSFSSLWNLYLNNKLVTELIIPDGVTSIGNYAFSFCNSFTSVSIPDSVTSIGDSAFYECSSLESITIPDSVTSISARAFSDCSSLVSIAIPDSVTSIGDSTFSYCNSLTSIAIGNGVTSISSDAFYECSSLADITVAEENEYYSSSEGVLFNKDKTELIQYPIGNSRTEYVIPDCVTDIDYSAFEYCSSLTSIIIPDSVIRIGSSAFRDCSSLESIIIGNNVRSISGYVFFNCESLINVTIPESVTSIGEKALGYYGNKKITGFTITGKIGSEAEMYANNNRFKFIDINAPVCAHTETELKNASSATCVKDGYTGDTYCKVCGGLVTKGRVSIATGHKFEHVTVASTCKVAGEDYNICTKCNEIINYKTLALADHTFGEWSVTTNATCTANGEKTRECSVCGEKETVATEMTDHVSEILPAKDATCTEKGLTDGEKCSVCGVVTKEQTEIPATGHTFGEWTLTAEATYINEGEKARECSVCGGKETQSIAKLEASQETVDENSNIAIKYQDSTYNGEVKVEAKEVFDGEYYQILNNEKGDLEKALFDITTTVNGEKVQPDGYVLVGIPLPEGFNPEETVVYYVKNDGSGLVEMNSYYADGCIWFETNHFSSYALVDETGVIKYTLGDVNGDEKVTAADARIVLRVGARLDTLEGSFALAADVNKDSKITAADARIILRVSAKLETL